MFIMDKLKTILLVLMPAFFTMLAVFCFTSFFPIQLVNGWWVAYLVAGALSFLTWLFYTATKEYVAFSAKMYSVIGVLAMVCLCFRHYELLYLISVSTIILLCVYFWIRIIRCAKIKEE